MLDRTLKVLLVLNLLALMAVFFRPSPALRSAAAQQLEKALPKDNQELSRLMEDDQVDRTPPTGGSIDWRVVSPRDEARLRRTKELYSQGQLQTGNDFVNAALILQHSANAGDYLLAHELCIV